MFFSDIYLGVELLDHMAVYQGFPGDSDGKKICLKCGRPRFNPRVGKIPWRNEWLPTPVFLPGEFHGQRILVGIVHGVAKSWTQLSN